MDLMHDHEVSTCEIGQRYADGAVVTIDTEESFQPAFTPHTMQEPPPPVYAERPPPNPVVDDYAPPPPPQYTFPTSFKIGTRQTPPFVHSPQLKGHLALLHSFALLRSQIVELSANVLLEDKDRRWSWFISLAVER